MNKKIIFIIIIIGGLFVILLGYNLIVPMAIGVESRGSLNPNCTTLTEEQVKNYPEKLKSPVMKSVFSISGLDGHKFENDVRGYVNPVHPYAQNHVLCFNYQEYSYTLVTKRSFNPVILE